jgi:hypothetical protein
MPTETRIQALLPTATSTSVLPTATTNPTSTPIAEPTSTPVPPTTTSTPTSTPTATPTATSTTAPMPTLIPTLTLTPTSTATSTSVAAPTPARNPYVVLVQPFACGDGITDISTNASFNGLFKSQGFDQYHGHMDIFPPDGCDISKDQMNAPITGTIKRYEFYEPDEGATNWGYHLIFPSGIYPAGIEAAFGFAGVSNFRLSQVSQVVLDVGHLTCKTGKVIAGEPICSVVPMPPKYGATRIAMQVGIDLKDGRGYMFSPTLFRWTGPKWDCHRVPGDSYCDPRPNFYKP